MNLPLSILLPVRNVQTTLHSIVHKLIDILPELTQQFELLIVDDGSTDATCEVAYELARDYPQIQVTRHAVALGWATAVTRQAALARGEFIMIHGGGSLETDDLVGLWRCAKALPPPRLPRRAQCNRANRGASICTRSPTTDRTTIRNRAAPIHRRWEFTPARRGPTC